MDTLCSDVLSKIIQRLPLQQKYQLLTVNQRFEEASTLALKEHSSLIIHFDVTCWDSPLNCWKDQHVSRGSADFIDSDCFEVDNTRKSILSRLPGLTFAYINLMITDEIREDLSVYCPKLQCLYFSVVGNIERNTLFIQPSLQHFHFHEFANGDLFNQLLDSYPSLTDLNISGHDLTDIQPSFFREGIESLQIDYYYDVDWNAVFTSPAMKTVKKIELNQIDFVEIDFVAKNLKEIDLRSALGDKESLQQFCTSLSKSLSYSQELQSFSLRTRVDAWEMPKSLFYSMNRLVSVCLPVELKNTNEIIEMICPKNPLLESISVGRVFGSKEENILDVFTPLTRLQSVYIDNTFIPQTEHGLTLEELNKFIDNNSVDDTLRFSFNLIQKENYPDEDSDKTELRGITWQKY